MTNAGLSPVTGGDNSADVVERIVAQVQSAAPLLGNGPGAVRLLVIDGPAGSGKTTLAARLGAALPAQTIHMDDLYEGWHGLEESWGLLDEWVLRPLAEGRAGRYRRFDWASGEFAEWHEVPLAPYLVVEGCGSARLEADAVACLRVWVQAPDDVRLVRGLDRDGESMRSRWIEWMDDERRHYLRNRTRQRADMRLDGWGREAGRPADRAH